MYGTESVILSPEGQKRLSRQIARCKHEYLRREEDTMVTLEKAYKIAKRLKPNIDNGTEMSDAFIFGSHEDDFTLGGDGPVVVWKANGEAYNMTYYFSISHGAKEIREFDL